MAEANIRFHSNWLRSAEWLPTEEAKGAFILKIVKYAFDGIEPDIEPWEGAAWELIKAAIEEDNLDRENGAKGGRPKKKAAAGIDDICEESQGFDDVGTESETPLSENENPPFDNQKPPFSKSKTPLSEEKNPPFEKNKPPFSASENPPFNPESLERERKRDREREREAEREREREIERERDLKTLSAEKRKRFRPPTVEEVAAYCDERGNGIDPVKFVDNYTAKGWMVGRSPMKDWKAAVRTWEQRRSERSGADNAEFGKYVIPLAATKAV